MNKIISMNHSKFGHDELESGSLTPLEKLTAKLEVAQTLQRDSFPQIVEKGWEMEGEVFVALSDLANTDPDHILNAEMDVDFDGCGNDDDLYSFAMGR